MEAADLSFSLLLEADGWLIDGMHRVCKASRRGDTHIQARGFPETPEPGFVGRAPGELLSD